MPNLTCRHDSWELPELTGRRRRPREQNSRLRSQATRRSVGCEEAEPQHPGEVGAAQAGGLRHLGYRATAAREDILQLMCISSDLI